MNQTQTEEYKGFTIEKFRNHNDFDEFLIIQNDEIVERFTIWSKEQETDLLARIKQLIDRGEM